MRKLLCITSIMLCIFLTACGNDNDVSVIGEADGPTSIYVAEKGETAMYQQITAEEAKIIMDSEEEYILLDVREQEEFDEGHIAGATLLPDTEIESKAETILPYKD